MSKNNVKSQQNSFPCRVCGASCSISADGQISKTPICELCRTRLAGEFEKARAQQRRQEIGQAEHS